ncbi:chorismate lyase [Achromobacter sp. AONIH1]|uniref:chorismate--pyruvate lyase family protein n=1 Tax=Achromobacter sp. AONIH1 TaxID=1758194 RepID=UPI000CD17029|nr:chorismate--pyruvate lyase [Achromobacter sp. AONIH1]
MQWNPYGPEAIQAVLSPGQWQGLGLPGSLTDRLRRLGEFRLCVREERTDAASDDEARAMGLAPGAPCWLREVEMSVDGLKCVAARSLTPLAASWDAWRGMRGLSERPLGSMLYDDPDVWRSPFEVTRLTAGSALFLMADAVARDAGATSPGLWARRSLFWRRDQPLLVAECFLPGFWVLSARASRSDGAGDGPGY